MKRSILPLSLAAAVAALSGFSTEVDKCVDAQVAAWEAEQQRLKDDIASGRRQQAVGTNEVARTIERLEGKVVVDTRSKAEVSADARLKCLQVTPGAK